MDGMLLVVFVAVASSVKALNPGESSVSEVGPGEGRGPNRGNQVKFSFKPPELSEEDMASKQMPRIYRCSGCLAVAFQFEKGFSSAEAKSKKKKSKLLYSDILEISENVCNKQLSGYGMKGVNGKKVLSGSGLKADTEMGMMDASPKWENRLKVMCAELIEQYEEENIYEQYVKRGNKHLAYSLCANHCSPDEMEELNPGKDEL